MPKYVNWEFGRDGLKQSIRVNGNYRIDNVEINCVVFVSRLLTSCTCGSWSTWGLGQPRLLGP